MQTHRKILIAPPVRSWKTLYFAHEYYQDQWKQFQNIFLLVKTLTVLNTKKLPKLSSHLSKPVKLEQKQIMTCGFHHQTDLEKFFNLLMDFV